MKRRRGCVALVVAAIALLISPSKAVDFSTSAYSAAASCEEALEAMLNPALAKGLAIANDASSKVNMDAYKILQPTTGYPGPIGDYGECGKVELFAPLETHLCLAGSVSSNTSAGIPPFGAVCVPVECEPADFESPALFGWLAAKYANLEELPTTTPTQLAFVGNLLTVLAIADKEFQGFTCGTYARPRFGADAWAVCGLLALLCAIVLVATVQDLVRDPEYPEDTARHPAAPRSPPGGYKYGVLNDHQPKVHEHISKYLAAFSVPRNLSRLFEVGERTELSCFEGLRVLSMLWVVLGHILAVQASVGYTNPEAVFPPNGLVSQLVGQLFFSARFAVDTFFFVSGFLVVYVMLRRFGSSMDDGGDGSNGRNGGKGGGNGRGLGRLSDWLPFFYVHRILRITPIYMVCLLVWWKVAVFLGEGPFWYRWQYFIALCDRSWWTNLLYVNNVVPWHTSETEECFYHTWYLANDMQFYVVSPFFIVLYLRNKALGAAATVGVLLASVGAMMWGTYARQWSALTFDGAWVVAYSEETYTQPWARIVPYLLGMMLAMFWDEKKRRWPRFKLNNAQRYLMMGGGIATLLTVTFAAHSAYESVPCSVKQSPDTHDCGSHWPVWLHALYNAGSRPAWILGVSMLCFVCFNNQGGLIQQMLEHRGWTPFARLSFGAYLLHPLIINLWFLNTTTKFTFSKLDFVMIYICVTAATFGCSLLLALLVESPLTKLGKYLEIAMKPSKQSRRERARAAAGIPSPVFDAAAQSPGFLTHKSVMSSAAGSCDEGSVDIAGVGELAQLNSGSGLVGAPPPPPPPRGAQPAYHPYQAYQAGRFYGGTGQAESING